MADKVFEAPEEKKHSGEAHGGRIGNSLVRGKSFLQVPQLVGVEKAHDEQQGHCGHVPEPEAIKWSSLPSSSRRWNWRS